MGKWDDFRYEPLAGEYDVGICTSSDDCRRGYSANKHNKGFADRFGTVHWTRWTSQPTRKRGLHRLLTLIATIKLQHRRRKDLPKWKALHETETWAQREAQARFHLRFPMSYSRQARMEAIEDVRKRNVPTRSIDMAAYQWMHAEKYKEKENT